MSKTSSQPVPTILCVDDELAGLQARSAVLRSAGYEVIPTTSAEKALEIFALQHIDLVLTDHLLQGTTGIEVAKQMKALRPDVPIVVFSGAELSLNSVEAEGARTVDSLLSKGAGPTEMLVHLSKLLKL